MKWSLKIGSYKGIPVYIHATFLIIIIWVAATHWFQTQNVAVMISGIFFVIAIFACVVLHEFGHALMAQKYGIRTRDITLLPIGGVARLEHMPDEPRQELWVAIAGPAVNVVIAAGLFMGLYFSAAFEPLDHLTMTRGSFWERLMVVNVFLVAFNMIPAFPMDGGRVLRALLAMRMGYSQATQIAASIGQGLAFLFGFIGIFFNPFLVLIALFVWIGAAQEANMAKMKTVFDGVAVIDATITDFETLQPDDTLTVAIDKIIAGYQQDFPVLENDTVIGILDRKQLISALSEHGPDYPVKKVMSKDFITVSANEMLQSALNRLQSCNCHILPVLRNNRLTGLLTMENIGEYMMIQSALKKQSAS